MTSLTSSFYVGNDSVLVVDGLKDRDGNAVLGAAVSLISFTDSSGNTPTGITLPAAFAEIGAGRYELALSRSIGVRRDKTYSFIVTATAAGLQGKWIETFIARNRAA